MEDNVSEFDPIVEATKALEEWKRYYIDMGEPPLSSNRYIEMTRTFFFMKGVEIGKRIGNDGR